MSFKQHFSHFLTSDPQRLHVAAHSHHPWPDATLLAQQQAWQDSARLQDDKWDHVFGVVIPEMAGHIARVLNLPDPQSVAVGPNTHEFVMRLFSCLPSPARVLTTDAEFHSFARQVSRWEEEGLVVVDRVAAEPFDTFPERFAEQAGSGVHDLVYFSQVHFNSAYATPDLAALVRAVKDDRTFVVIDGYHGFLALPTDLSAIAERAFYLGGGYKYAMAGEGARFLHCPSGYGSRPVDTGWFAGFAALSAPQETTVAYPAGGQRFLGGTLDPTAFYRFNAVQEWLAGLGLTVAKIHQHVVALQERFLDLLNNIGLADVGSSNLLPARGRGPRGNFLTFSTPSAPDLYHALRAGGVVPDLRGDRLRIGFGIYHDPDDVDELCSRLQEAVRKL